MLKKLMTISLAFLYLMVSSGLLVEIHHCMGRIADSSLHLFGHHQNDDDCGRCGMPKSEESSHCCKDEVKLVKVEDDQKAGNSISLPSAPSPIEITTPWLAVLPPVEFIAQLVHIDAYPQPPPESVSFQILHGVFRI